LTAYGILLVDTSWANHDSVEIDKTAHLRHKDRLVEGTKALIYIREPVDAIIAEAEITGDIIETETDPPDPAFNPAIPANLHSEREIERLETEADPLTAVTGNQVMAKTYYVPLKVVRLKGQTPPIPLARLQTILGSDFSVYDETWIPLTEKQYRAVAALWSMEHQA
jgi:hypothetical protein